VLLDPVTLLDPAMLDEPDRYERLGEILEHCRTLANEASFVLFDESTIRKPRDRVEVGEFPCYSDLILKIPMNRVESSVLVKVDQPPTDRPLGVPSNLTS